MSVYGKVFIRRDAEGLPMPGVDGFTRDAAIAFPFADMNITLGDGLAMESGLLTRWELAPLRGGSC